MLVRPQVTIRIDLNALRGDRITTRRPMLFFGPGQLGPGDYVLAVEEEGDSYVGVIDAEEGDLLRLRLLLETRIPALRFDPPLEDFGLTRRLMAESAPATRTLDEAVDLAVA